MKWRRRIARGKATKLIVGDKARAKPRKLEEPIHIQCFNWLDQAIDGLVYHVPNGLDGGKEMVFIGGRMVPKAAISWNKLVKMGARSGVLDLTIHWRGIDAVGRTAYLEVKFKEKTLRGRQKDFATDLNRCGIQHTIVHSLDECKEAVRWLGCPLTTYGAFTINQKVV